MSIKGGSWAHFRRAVAAGQPLVALAAARELPALSLADALALTLVLRGEERLFERAAVRWHSRFLRDAGYLSLADATLSLAALALMPTSFETGAAALAAVCERHGRDDLVTVIEDALSRLA